MSDKRDEAQRALITALVVVSLIVAVFVSSCGSQGLTFPGNVLGTPTAQFTATVTPITATPTP